MGVCLCLVGPPWEAIGNHIALPVHDHPGSDRVGAWLSCKGVILVEEHGHSPPPPSPILVGGPRIYHFSTFYVRDRLSGGTHRFSTCWWWRSSSSPLFSVTVGPLSVLSMLS